MIQRNQEIERFSFVTVSPDQLTNSQRMALLVLIQQSVMLDYPTRSSDERVALRTRVTNRAFGNTVPDDTLRPKQSFANRAAVLAFEKDKPDHVAAYVGVADAASGRLPKPLNTIEQYAKLHVERLIGNKWRWLAMRAVEPQLQPHGDQFDDSALTVLDVLGFLAVDLADKRQPVSAYPYLGEYLWPQTLRSWGLATIPGEQPERIPAFGKEYPTVLQTHMTAGTAEGVLETIAGKDSQNVIDSYVYANLENRLEP